MNAVVLAIKGQGSMIGIVFSTEQEASPFLKSYARGRLDGLTEGETIHDDEVLVSILGIGKIKATLRTERLLRSHPLDRIVLAGGCKTLGEEPAVGDIVMAAQVFEGDRVELSAPTYPRMPVEVIPSDFGSYRLVTQDHTIADQKELSYWQRVAHVNDSSGYAVAYVAGMHGTKCNIIKVVVGEALSEESSVTRPPSADTFSTLGSFMLEVLPKLIEADA